MNPFTPAGAFQKPLATRRQSSRREILRLNQHPPSLPPFRIRRRPGIEQPAGKMTLTFAG